jgi:two-component system chemotaxis response regulator CheY
MLQKLLKNFWPGQILLACDGQEGWEILQAENPSLVVIDWMMPRMNGIELCRKIRQTNFNRYVYTILLTARDDQKDVLEGLEAGADDYVRKPFNPQELRLRLKAALRVIELEKQLAKKNSELLTLNNQLEELARIDPLMKIANRHSFHEVIERVHTQFLRYKQNYGLLMCDVDYFKQYNDTMGHQAGDRILQVVASTIKNNIRQADEAFRYGGEEIVVILPSQELEGAMFTGQRLCQSIFNASIPHPRGVNGCVSISVGATACTADNSAADWKEILEQADKALYQAKKTGRNQMCSFGRDCICPLHS